MYLVTGATGFLGSHLVCHLLLKGFKVKAMKRKQSRMDEFEYISTLLLKEQKQPLSENLVWVEADLNDMYSLETALEHIDQVFHCAAKVSFHSKDADEMLKTNHEGTANLVNACLHNGVMNFFYVSSTAAIGASTYPEPANEELEWKKNKHTSTYSISKYLAEMEVWRGGEEGLNICMVNPSIILGPGIWKRGTCRLFYNVYHNFPFYSSGSNAFVDVSDVCKAILFLHEKGISGERFLVHGTNEHFKELFFKMADIMGKKRPWIGIGKTTAGVAWRTFHLIGKLTGNKGLITRESAESSVKQQNYTSAKIEKLGFTFLPLSETLEHTIQALNACYSK